MKQILIANKKNLIILSIFILFFGVYTLTSSGKTPYDYFTRLASSLLKGKYYLSENPPWLSELIPLSENRFTFVNPPMPAFLALPFVAIFPHFEQQHLAHLLGAASTIATGLLAYKIKKSNSLAIWSSLLLGFGSIFWYLSATGSVWYLGQVTSVFFLLLALNEAFGHKRPFIVSLFFAAALLSRLQIILSLPLFLYLLKDRLSIKNTIFFLIPLGFFALIYFLYNYLRFGDPLQNGYTLIPNILNEPWFSAGQFSLSYIPNHLKILFLGLPHVSSTYPYLWPSWAGMAIWLTTPAFIFSLRASFKKAQTLIIWITIFSIGLLNFSYGSTGFSQFGYRYAVDFYPFLVLLAILGIEPPPKWYHWLLLLLAIIVNLWGVIMINKLGLASF